MNPQKLVEQLDQALERLPVEPAPAGLRERIMAELPEDSWQRLSNWLTASLWRPALAAAFSLALGFAIGFYQTEPADQDLVDELSMLAFSADFEELPYDD
jgi:predicted Abi (CAAX) family protease